MMNVRKLTTMAMLTAISMIVFLIEAQIPLPFAVPGVKLGIANVITLYAIWTLGRREALAILLIRVFLGNIIAGNVMAMAYSLAGGLLCWVIMSLLKPVMGRSQIWLMSILGALGHNAGQLGMVILISGTTTMIWYAPVLIVAAVVTGAFTGYLTQILLGHMDKLQKHA
jgi:heptaprenyl diphosphate synthase